MGKFRNWDRWVKGNPGKVGRVSDELVAATRKFEKDNALEGLVDALIEALSVAK
ncbi:MAG: hypothetical protein IT431_18215 [Phycisphaerales bacterium]|nr:hypothetical protein [Phycisphaerales bacterium]